MIPATAQNSTLLKYSNPWNPALKLSKPQLIAHWEKDENGKLYCRWIKA